MEFLKCKHCENVIAFVKNTGNNVSCCNEIMEKMIPNNTDASEEKHMPVFTRDGKYLHVSVGDVIHPFTNEHHIEWIALVTRNGNQRKILNHEVEPKVSFLIEEDDEILELYAYCNLHGLWGFKK